mmetsp:Transcript_39488/g.104381  ORF Transcript_39488/g.104381 Transcript_39488/m.104381 type:complete len:231 (-) Transcript_39488:221-913(-)
MAEAARTDGTGQLKWETEKSDRSVETCASELPCMVDCDQESAWDTATVLGYGDEPLAREEHLAGGKEDALCGGAASTRYPTLRSGMRRAMSLSSGLSALIGALAEGEEEEEGLIKMTRSLSKVSWGDVEIEPFSPISPTSPVSPAASVTPAGSHSAVCLAGADQEKEEEDDPESPGVMDMIAKLCTKAEERRMRRSVAPRGTTLSEPLPLGTINTSSLLSRRLSQRRGSA